MKYFIILTTGAASLLLSCSKNKTTAAIDCSTSKSWSADVSPVILSSCSYSSGCHGSGSNKGPGALVNYTEVYNNRSVIRSSVVSGQMPENGSLNSASISAIVCWIDAGAANN